MALGFVIRGAIACWELCAPAKGLLGNVVSCTLGAVISEERGEGLSQVAVVFILR